MWASMTLRTAALAGLVIALFVVACSGNTPECRQIVDSGMRSLCLDENADHPDFRDCLTNYTVGSRDFDSCLERIEEDVCFDSFRIGGRLGDNYYTCSPGEIPDAFDEAPGVTSTPRTDEDATKAVTDVRRSSAVARRVTAGTMPLLFVAEAAPTLVSRRV